MMNAPRILESIRTSWPTPIAELWAPNRVPAFDVEHVRAIADAAMKTLGIVRGWMLAEASVIGSPSNAAFGFTSLGANPEEAQVNDIVRELLDALRALSSTLNDSVFRATNALGTWFLLDTRLQALKDAIRTSSSEGYRTDGYAARRLLDSSVAVLEQLDPILTVLELLQVEAVAPMSGGLRVTWRPLVGLRPPPPVQEEYPGARSDFPEGCGDRLRCRHKLGLVLCLDRPFPARSAFANVDAWAEELKEWEAPARSAVQETSSGVRHLQFSRVAGSSGADVGPPGTGTPGVAASPFATPTAAAAAAAPAFPASSAAASPTPSTESTDEIRARLLARIQAAHAEAAQGQQGGGPAPVPSHFAAQTATPSSGEEVESRSGVPELHRRFAEWLADEVDRHHGFDPRRDRDAMAQVTGVASATLNALRNQEHAEIHITQLTGAIGQRIRYQRTISRSEAGTVLGAGGLARLRRADDFMPNDAIAPPLPQQPGRNGWGNANAQVAEQIRAQQAAAGAQTKKSGCGGVIAAMIGLSFVLGLGGVVMMFLVVDGGSEFSSPVSSILESVGIPSATTPVDDKPLLDVAQPDPEIVRGQAILHATFALGVDRCPSGRLLSDGRVFDRLERPVPMNEVANTLRRHACGSYRAPWRLVSYEEADALIEANPELRNARGIWLGQTRRPEMPSSIFFYGDEKPAPGTTATAEIWVIHGR